MPLEDDDRKALTCDPGDYIYKYTISSTENSWLMVYHFEAIKLDLEVRVYHLDHSRASKVFEHIRHLLSVRSEYILTPEKVFNWCGETWLIFPLYIGRPLNEVLTRHYTHGLPNERVTARILLDVLEALEVLHEANLCHRALATYNLFLEKDTGRTKLKDFANVKLFEAEDKANLRATMWRSPLRTHLMPPEMQGLSTEKNVDEKKADIFLFAVTAMNLAFGSPPRNPIAKGNIAMKPTDWVAPSDKDYLDQPEHISDSFRAMLAACLLKNTCDRPSAQELKKDKFFNKAAGRNEVKELVCSSMKIAEPSNNLKDVPPSQEEKGPDSSAASVWNFQDNYVRKSTRSMNTGLSGVDDSKEFTPSMLTIDDIDEKSGAVVGPSLTDSPAKFLPDKGSSDIAFKTEDAATEKGPTVADTIQGINVAKMRAAAKGLLKSDGDVGTSNQRNAVAKPKSRFVVEEVLPFDQAAKPTPMKDAGAALSINDGPRKPVEQKKPVPALRASPQLSAQSSWTTKHPSKWEIEDVCEWLMSLGGDFKVYTNYFREAGIDGEMLKSLTDEELEELQVTKKIHRRRILTSIKKLARAAGSPM